MINTTYPSAVSRRVINTWTGQDAFGYVQANEIAGAERMLICSGQLATAGDGNVLHANDMRGQIGQSVDNLETVLRAAGFAGPRVQADEADGGRVGLAWGGPGLTRSAPLRTLPRLDGTTGGRPWPTTHTLSLCRGGASSAA